MPDGVLEGLDLLLSIVAGVGASGASDEARRTRREVRRQIDDLKKTFDDLKKHLVQFNVGLVLDRISLLHLYGHEPALAFYNVIRYNGKIVNETYAEEPIEPITIDHTTNCDRVSVSRSRDGYELECVSTDGRTAWFIAWLSEVKDHKLLVAMAKYVSFDDGRGPFIAIGKDLYNAYVIALDIPNWRNDFRIWQIRDGTWRLLAGEYVDLGYGTQYHIAMIVDLEEGHFIVFRDGAMKFNIRSKDFDLVKIGIGMWTIKRSTPNIRRLVNPIVVGVL